MGNILQTVFCETLELHNNMMGYGGGIYNSKIEHKKSLQNKIYGLKKIENIWFMDLCTWKSFTSL